MPFQSRRIERLRQRLTARGRPSVAPTPWSLRTASPELAAIYERILPLAEMMYLVIAADSVVAEAERETLRGALRILTAGELGTRATDSMMADFERALEHDGLEARLDDIAAQLYGDREDAELALSLAAAVAVADGRVDAAEERTIVGLAERLGISRKRLARLLSDNGDGDEAIRESRSRGRFSGPDPDD